MRRPACAGASSRTSRRSPARFSAEVGRRWYRQGADAEDLITYSDFTYLELWLMASIHVTANLSLDVMAGYEPERHTEQDDDLTLGSASLSLVLAPLTPRCTAASPACTCRDTFRIPADANAPRPQLYLVI